MNAVLVAKRWNRVLVDVTQWRSIPTALELFEFAKGLSSGLKLKVRVAFVVRPDQAKHARLIEKVARNDSVFLTYFHDVEKATFWVQGSLPRHDLQRWHLTDTRGANAVGSNERQAGFTPLVQR